MTDLEAINFLVLTIHAYERLLRAQPSNTHTRQLIQDCKLARQWLINTATTEETALATSPPYKVYKDFEYRASTKYAEDAAALTALLGNGTTIRYEHNWILWSEGKEDQSAADSYDHVAQLCHQRLADKQLRYYNTHTTHVDTDYPVETE